MIDRVVARRGRRLMEVPVGFKWFAPGLFDGSCCFGGEESAGAALPAHGRDRVDHRQGRAAARPAGRRDHRPHRARPRRALSGADRARSGRRSTPASTPRRAPAEKAKLQTLSPEAVRSATLAGDPIVARLVRAPGNDAPIGGLKVASEQRLVRRPALGHRGHREALCRELPRAPSTWTASWRRRETDHGGRSGGDTIRRRAPPLDPARGLVPLTP